VMASELPSLGIRAGVDFAGAAMTWHDSPLLQRRMRAAVRHATFPVFFAQAENDYDTAPSKVLAGEMKSAGKPHQLKIYPPNGTTAEDGHAFCGGGDNPPWGADVLDFFATRTITP